MLDKDCAMRWYRVANYPLALSRQGHGFESHYQYCADGVSVGEGRYAFTVEVVGSIPTISTII